MGWIDWLCCGCLSPKATLVSAFYCVFMAVMCMSMMLIKLSAGKDHHNYEGLTLISYASLVVYSLLIVFSFILLAGANTGKRQVYLPWFIHMVLVMVFEAFATGLVYFSNYKMGVHPWDMFCSLFYGVRTVVNVYCMCCVLVQFCLIRSISKDSVDDNSVDGKSMKDIYSIEGGYSDDDDAHTNVTESSTLTRSTLIDNGIPDIVQSNSYSSLVGFSKYSSSCNHRRRESWDEEQSTLMSEFDRSETLSEVTDITVVTV